MIDLQIAELKKLDRPEFSTQWWKERVAEMEAYVSNGIPEDVLSIPGLIAGGVTTNNFRASRKIKQELPWIPWYLDDTDTSHVYHLHKSGIRERAGAGTVVEWGGGFGNYAKLSTRMGVRHHHIIDVPVMQLIQKRHLDGLRASENVSWGCNGDPTLIAFQGRVDTFLGLWSVSECTHYAHDWLIDEMDWYGASNVFLAIEPDKGIFPEATGLHARLIGLGFVEEESYYQDTVYMRLTR